MFWRGFQLCAAAMTPRNMFLGVINSAVDSACSLIWTKKSLHPVQSMNPMNMCCVLSKRKEDVISSEDDFCFPQLQWLQETLLLSLLLDLDKSGVTNNLMHQPTHLQEQLTFGGKAFFQSTFTFLSKQFSFLYHFAKEKVIKYFHTIKFHKLKWKHSFWPIYSLFSVWNLYYTNSKKLSLYPIYRSCCSVTVLWEPVSCYLAVQTWEIVQLQYW